MKDILQSMREEFLAMFSGKFVPYHMIAWIISCATALVFCALTSHGISFEGRLAVIDADGSRLSTEIIERLNTSPYIEVTEVLRGAVRPEALLQHDRNIGVLYFPRGLEKAAARGEQFSVGYFADFTNIAQNGQMVSALSEIVPEAGSLAINRRPGTSETKPSSSGSLAVVERKLFNPTHSSTTVFTVTFIHFFSSIFYGITVLMIIGRLKITGMWERAVLPRGPAAFVARLVPYAACYTTAITAVTSILATMGQLPFAGSWFWYVPTIFLTAIAIGLLGFAVSWHTTMPGQGSSYMILVVPPGFIMGGALLTTGFLNPVLVHLKWIWPLSWQYSFWRDFALRGASISEMMSRFGAYFIYIALLGALITLLFRRASRRQAGGDAPGRRGGPAPAELPRP